MKKFFLIIVLAFTLGTVVMGDASARRFGGGSFGRHSFHIGRTAPMLGNMNSTTRQQAGQSANRNQNNNATSSRSRFSHILGGALLGLGLGALLSHIGISEGMSGMISSLLMIAIIYFVARFLLRKFFGNKRTQVENKSYAEQGANTSLGSQRSSITPEIGSGIASNNAPSEQNSPVWGIPADFDVPGFLRSSKTAYLRMQAAWDKGDIQDIHEFTTPEMFAEIRMQLEERGNEENVTDVVQLNAELLGIEFSQGDEMASVKFSGLVCETVGEPAQPFEEVWNFVRSKTSDSWILAGVQMINRT